MKTRESKGFTLIEILIVVAIIGILSSTALATYNVYNLRAQAAEGLSLAAPAKFAVSAFAIDAGEFPADNSAAGIGPPSSYHGQYVDQVRINGNNIEIVYGNKASARLSGQFITLAASMNEGTVSWECVSGTIPQIFLPNVCK